MRYSRLLAFALLAGCGACAAVRPELAADAGPACRGAAQPMARLELLFGRARAGGPAVSDAEWADFLDGEVTPRFPDGFTALGGAGQWRGRDGAVLREPSTMLVIWYRPSAAREADIEAVRAAYKRRFGQESVLRADGLSCVSF
jgi:hypothetical protein